MAKCLLTNVYHSGAGARGRKVVSHARGVRPSPKRMAARQHQFSGPRGMPLASPTT